MSVLQIRIYENRYDVISVEYPKIWLQNFTMNKIDSNSIEITLIFKFKISIIINFDFLWFATMETSRIILYEVGIKAKSFKELYRLLTVEGGLYLPPSEYTNMSFISDICFGDKKVVFVWITIQTFHILALKADDVRVCTVPHLKGLRTVD